MWHVLRLEPGPCGGGGAGLFMPGFRPGKSAADLVTDAVAGVNRTAW